MLTKDLIYHLDRKWKDLNSFIDSLAETSYNTDCYLLRELLRSMTNQEIKELLPGLKQNGAVYKLAESFLDRRPSEQGKLTKPLVSTEKRVYSTQQYLKWYTDKKSGRVTEAKKMLEAIYEVATNHFRHEIIKAFLQGAATDRKWAYTKLMNTDNWNAMYEPFILDNWKKYRDARCCWLLTRYFPDEVLLEHAEWMKIDFSYYFLCKRLVGNPAFTIDWQFLKQHTIILRYLELRALSGDFCSRGEARELIFQWIAFPLYFHRWLKSGQVVSYNLPDLYYGDMYPLNLEGMDKALFYLCKMGYADLVLDIYRWADEVVQDALHVPQSASEGKDEDLEKKKDALDAVIIMNFPPEYYFMLDFDEWTVFGVMDRKNRPLATWKSDLDYLLEHNLPVPADDDEELFPYESEEIHSPQQAASSEMLQKMREKNPSLDSFLDKLGY